jgi:hypothetical protein
MLASCWLPEVAITNENHNAYISSTQTVVMAFIQTGRGYIIAEPKRAEGGTMSEHL